jgi:muramoyltetrapeptide carboxypeptidase
MILKARALRKGDVVGVVSPASPSENRSDVVRARETLEDMGYRVKIAPNVNKNRGFTAASEEERAADFNGMVRDDGVDAIFALQGGYGSAQIISRIDFEALAANPKIFTGFSDISALHLAIRRFTGLVSFHGPGFARFNSEDLTDYTRDCFFRAVSGEEAPWEVKTADPKKWLNPIAGGVAEGRLTGGNLSLICASLGTPFEIETAGQILFFEEVDAEPWMVDHCLSHLRNAGKLRDLKGVVIGECDGCMQSRCDPAFYVDTSLEDVLEYYLADLGVPALYGLPLGHGDDLATLPLGVRVRLDADNKTLTVLEKGVE